MWYFARRIKVIPRARCSCPIVYAFIASNHSPTMRRLNPTSLARRIPRRIIPSAYLRCTPIHPRRPSHRFASTTPPPADDPRGSGSKGSGADVAASPSQEAGASKVAETEDPWSDYHTICTSAYRTDPLQDHTWAEEDSIAPQLWSSFLPASQVLEHPSFDSAPEMINVIATHIEGGEGYISSYLREVASRLSADVIELFTPLVVGLDGPASPMRRFGECPS